MKISKKLIFTMVLAFGLLISAGPASAHYLWMDPIGQQDLLSPGDAVGIDVYLHAEENDNLHGWSLSVGFDDTAVDGGELTWNNIVFGPSDLTNDPMYHTYEIGLSEKHIGESWVCNIARWSVLGFMPPEVIEDGEDFLLFTANFTYNGGAWDGLEDIWLEDDGGIDGWDFDNAGAIHELEIYTDNTKTTLLGNGGPDFAAVPIPGAIFLLVPAFLGMIGLRRKKA